jgi:ferredoxin-NADP reductase
VSGAGGAGVPAQGSAQTRFDLAVAAIRSVAADVAAIELRDPAGAPLPPWSPGAHIDVDLGPGLVRQYSLCGSPDERRAWRIAVLREPSSRGGSARMHQLREGDVVRVTGLRNHFELSDARRYVFIAGGIGITPVIPMIGAAEARGRSWALHYGGRTAASMAFGAELQERYPGSVHLHPQDRDGLLDLPGILGTEVRDDALVYCCGPEPLVRAVEDHCRDWPAAALRTERFVPREAGEPVLTGAFRVQLARSGLTLEVPPDRTILQAVEDAGVFVLSSCQEGTCGTCETKIIEGTADHRDSLLRPEEQAANETMMICVSRAISPVLVLDL